MEHHWIRTARFSSIVFFIFLSSLTFVESAQFKNAPAAAPTLIYSTYLGGGIADQIWAMTVDAAAYVYVTGYTASSNLPVINALQPNYAGQGDGFVAKFKPDGTPVYITYLGGTYLDSAQDIAVDSAGNAYITGWTGSTDFPTVNAFQPNYAGVWDAFVCKISSDGSTLIYSSYLGGSNQEDRINAGTPGSIAVDSTGAAYVTGDTQSDDFPTLNAYQPSLIGTSDIFITKISPSGSSLVYSTYLGGERTEATFGIAVDSTGVAYVVGDTQSFAYPTANPAQPDCVAGPDGSCWDAIVSVLSSDGSALVYSTYLGGNS
ncbi:MAG: SBBP repeat-containing protein, partial [Anaerolineae bacterium]|nr:SBBP repeat-containing protein [Anaerolineae bacterium]